MTCIVYIGTDRIVYPLHISMYALLVQQKIHCRRTRVTESDEDAGQGWLTRAWEVRDWMNVNKKQIENLQEGLHLQG